MDRRELRRQLVQQYAPHLLAQIMTNFPMARESRPTEDEKQKWRKQVSASAVELALTLADEVILQTEPAAS